MSRVLSCPYAGRILADLGADVVKLESPEGDLIRIYGAERAGQSGFYVQQNAGKRNVSVDLRTDEGIALATELAAVSDVVIENFRPGVADRLGIGWSSLSMLNPGLVMLSISGFGADEPGDPRAAFAAVIHAASGLIARQAMRDGVPPVDPMLSIADSLAGLHGVIAVLAALRLREFTGEGQWIDMAMFDAMIATDEYAHHYLDGSPPARLGGLVWQAADGPVLIAADQRHTWIRLAATYELTDGCASDASFPDKVGARRLVIGAWIGRHAKADLFPLLAAADLLSSEVVEPRDALRGADSVRRRMVARIVGRDGGGRDVIQTPNRYSAAHAGVRGPAPHRGEHNADVLREWLDRTDPEV
jgi:CoA:oxalate CoA-transferase